MSSEIEESFFEKVYAVVRQIPPGRVTSYGAIARFLGTGRSARMVGWALNHSQQSGLAVPAQRVVNRVGLLTGKFHFPTTDLMEALLIPEGLTIKDDIVQDFEKYFWDPAIELNR